MVYLPTFTPLKINMEPKNHLIEKQKSSSKPPFLGFKMLIFQGVTFSHIVEFYSKYQGNPSYPPPPPKLPPPQEFGVNSRPY